jgi:hypothetical protein
MIVQTTSAAVHGFESSAQISIVELKFTRHGNATCDKIITVNFLRRNFYH